jgi:peptide deformylase
MALLDILKYPDPRLFKVATPVSEITPAIKKLVTDMAETMYHAPGVGLAATQVNVHQRVIVIDISKKQNDLLVLINPVIKSKQGIEESEEGCLSVPEIYETVQRAEVVVVDALDREGKPFTLQADGLLATCIQHEIDHLDGKVFVQYLSQLKQTRIKAKLLKRQRQRL